MSVRSGDVDQMWTKLGFTIDYKAADVKAKLIVDGKVVVKTFRSQGRGKIDGQIPHFIRQQMRLNDEQFDRAIQCPLKRPEYLEILRTKGIIE